MWSAMCPFCFHVHDFRSRLVCPETGHEVPEAYVTETATTPALWLMTVGFKGHGKTCFIAALSQVLESMQLCSPGFFTPLDPFSFKRIREIREQAAGNMVEASTAPGVPRPLLLQACGLPGADSRCLVVYDLPGETFDHFDRVAELAPAMRAVQTVWFFVCLQDLEKVHQGRTLQELFAVYRAGMRRLRIGLKGRTLIVVFTKFDQQREPPRVAQYILDDPFQRWMAAGKDGSEAAPDGDWSLRLADYRQEMTEISKVLATFTHTTVRGGAGFIHMAHSEGMEVAFTATSALGQDPAEGGWLPEKASPRRVLDPYLWATLAQAEVVASRFHLVVDAAPDDAALPDVSALWQRLAGFAEVATYFLGRRARSGVAGQAPLAPSKTLARARLIGPLLESLPTADRVLILATGPLLDLEDFAATDWVRRLLIVACGKGSTAAGGGEWSAAWSVLPAPSSASMDEVVERFLRLS